MSHTCRLISEECTIHSPNLDSSQLIPQKNYIFRKPAGKFLAIGFVSHQEGSKQIHPFVSSLVAQDIGVVYVCESLPENPIIDPHVLYIECPYRWYVHTLFINPLDFRGVFGDSFSTRLIRGFSEFTQYHIPIIRNETDLNMFMGKTLEDVSRVLLEITGGIGDHLMCIPTIKTLVAQGNKVSVLCQAHRVPCFDNLEYIESIFTHRSKVDISQYDKIFILHFGQILNDYRQAVNQQNRIFSVAEVCGINRRDLVIDTPEIILSSDELAQAKKRYSEYPNKLFFGFDSARIDARIPESLAQEKINHFKLKGFTVFTTALKKYNLKNCIDLSGSLSLREMFALLAVMDYIVTIDTGFLHVAGALGKKTFALMNFFDPSWRCGTYKNCTSLTPRTKCFPCVGRQFVPSSKWECHNKSCFSHFNWERLYQELRVLKLKTGNRRKQPEDIKTCTPVIGVPLEITNTLGLSVVDQKQNTPQIAAFWMGGIGDAVMLRALCKAIYRKHGAQVTAFVRDSKQAELFRWDSPEIKVRVSGLGWRDTIKKYKDKYDLSYEFSRYPVCWVKEHPQTSFDEGMYANWGTASKPILSGGEFLAFYYAKQVGLDLSWEDFKLSLPGVSAELQDIELKKYGLVGPYITVHSGSDNGTAVMKMWDLPSWTTLCSELRSQGHQVVQLGVKGEKKIQGVSFIEATTLSDLVFLLGHSRLHIDGEGGLVHLAHSVGTKSVVLFGATDPKVYGYPTNVNIYADKCPSCWWQKAQWSTKCMKGHSSCVNLRISPKEVLAQVKVVF